MTTKDLHVWQKSMDLAVSVYRLTRTFPREEVYGLTSQLRRAAVSIPSNIAEGSARGGKKEFIQFLTIARGSSSEVETQLLLASRVEFAPEIESLILEVTSIRQMLNGLIRSLRESNEKK